VLDHQPLTLMTYEPDRDLVDGQALQGASVSGPGFGGRLNQGVRLLWVLAAAFKNPEEIFDKRPRGSAMSQTAGKIPGVGTIGGCLMSGGRSRRPQNRPRHFCTSSRCFPEHASDVRVLVGERIPYLYLNALYGSVRCLVAGLDAAAAHLPLMRYPPCRHLGGIA